MPATASPAQPARLRKIAADLRARGEAEEGRERLENTHKRREEAAQMRKRGREQQRLADTLDRLAAEQEAGRSEHLAAVRSVTHVEALDRVARSALHRQEDAQDARPVGHSGYRLGPRKPLELHELDLAFVRVPFPRVRASHLLDALAGQSSPGVAGRAALDSLRRQAKRAKPDDIIVVTEPTELAELRHMSKHKENHFTLGDSVTAYDRIAAMGLADDARLKAAIGEYLGCCRGEARKASPLEVARQKVAGIKIPGYVPTPAPAADRLVLLAGIPPGARVLEPEAGKGDLVEAILRSAPSADIDVIERSYDLRHLLGLQGFKLVGDDMLAYQGGPYDRVVMNPPFEDGQDMSHVRHAYELLVPGGRLAAIVSEGPFFRNDARSQAFRAWLEELGAHVEKLPDHSFRTSTYSTDVPARIVIIDKPGHTRPPTRETLSLDDMVLGAFSQPASEPNAWTGRRFDEALRLIKSFRNEVREQDIRSTLAALNSKGNLVFLPDGNFAGRRRDWHPDTFVPDDAHFVATGLPGANAKHINSIERRARRTYDLMAAAVGMPPQTTEDTRPTRAAGRADFQERRERRIEGLETRAAKKQGEASALWESSHKRLEGIPMGQPILVGHHSERGHRRAVERSHADARRSIDTSNEAVELAHRAAAAASSRAISSDDPDSIEKLKAKLTKIEADRAQWKDINKAVRKKDPQQALAALGLSAALIAKLLTRDFAGRIGIPDYQITNSGAEVRRLKARIAELEARAKTEAPADHERGDFRATWDSEENRVAFYSPYVADKATREKKTERMRGEGFHWSPTNKRWQRQASMRAWHAAVQLVDSMASAAGATAKPPQAEEEDTMRATATDEPDRARVDVLLTKAYQDARWLPWGPPPLDANDNTWWRIERLAWGEALGTTFPSNKGLKFLLLPADKRRELVASGKNPPVAAHAMEQIIVAAENAGFHASDEALNWVREQQARLHPGERTLPTPSPGWTTRLQRFRELTQGSTRERQAPPDTYRAADYTATPPESANGEHPVSVDRLHGRYLIQRGNGWAGPFVAVDDRPLLVTTPAGSRDFPNSVESLREIVQVASPEDAKLYKTRPFRRLVTFGDFTLAELDGKAPKKAGRAPSEATLRRQREAREAQEEAEAHAAEMEQHTGIGDGARTVHAATPSASASTAKDKSAAKARKERERKAAAKTRAATKAQALREKSATTKAQAAAKEAAEKLNGKLKALRPSRPSPARLLALVKPPADRFEVVERERGAWIFGQAADLDRLGRQLERGGGIAVREKDLRTNTKRSSAQHFTPSEWELRNDLAKGRDFLLLVGRPDPRKAAQESRRHKNTLDARSCAAVARARTADRELRTAQRAFAGAERRHAQAASLLKKARAGRGRKGESHAQS